MDYEKFDSLNAEEQLRLFAQCSLRDKGEMILRGHDPMRLAHSVSGEELYLISKEMDTDERSELVRYAGPDQLFFIADIDCWVKDSVNPEGFIRWLEILLGAGEEKLVTWLTRADYEALVAGFQKFIRVVKPDREYAADELLGDHPYFSIDQRYYVLVEEQNLETIKRALEILYENAEQRYVVILEGVMGELEYEAEEEAYRRREIRLSQRGFPDVETARKIYQVLTNEAFEAFPLKDASGFKTNAEGEAGPAKLPDYPVLWSWDRLFLDDALLVLAEQFPQSVEQVHEEMVWLSNKIIVLEGMDFTSEEKVRRGVARMRSLLSVSLEMLSERDLARAAMLLRERWLEAVFRRGMSRVLGLRDQARELLRATWKGDKEDFFSFWDAPYDVIIRGLLEFPPQCFDAQVKEQLYPLRDFRSIEDLEKSQKGIDQMGLIHGFLMKTFPSSRQLVQGEKDGGERPVTLFKILGTAYAHFVLGGRLSVKPVTQAQFAEFLAKAFEPRDTQRVLRAGMKSEFLGRYFTHSERDKLLPLWGLVFQQIQEETGRLKTDRGVLPDFLATVDLLAPVVKKPAKPSSRARKAK